MSTLETSQLCYFCGDSDLELMIPSTMLPEDDVNVMRCRKCDLVFLAAESHIKQFESEETEYWNNKDQKKVYTDEDVQKEFVREFESRLDVLGRFFPHQGTLLDVGCGTGHFLNQARKRGWQVQGLDISRGAKKAAAELYNLEVEVGTLEKTSFQPGSFDVITLWDVIEHIREPIENLRYAHRLLKDNGILVLKTPNERGFFKQSALMLYRILGASAGFLLKYVYYLPHYFSYSEKSMSLLLKHSGYQAVRFESDQTPQEFATEKINIHYQRDPKRQFVISMLPLAGIMSRLLGSSNKMVVYARKIPGGS